MEIVNCQLQIPLSWRAWCYLVWLSFQRQARAHLMVWIALGLLGLTLLVIIRRNASRSLEHGQLDLPAGKGPTYVGASRTGNSRMDTSRTSATSACSPGSLLNRR